jgi:hypothetical protein
MESVNLITGGDKPTFFNHVFSTTEDGKAELLNIVQYATLAIIPIVILNKSIQRFVPEADAEKSSLEITIEILIQLIVIFVGILLIHRIITFLPTYSGFKYENLSLTGVTLAFLVLVLSIQSKLGLKVNILVDRLGELWNGPSSDSKKARTRVRQSATSPHVPSQGDYVDNNQVQNDMFPPPPSVSGTTRPPSMYDSMMHGSGTAQPIPMMDSGPLPANGVLGGSFGASF